MQKHILHKKLHLAFWPFAVGMQESKVLLCGLWGNPIDLSGSATPSWTVWTWRIWGKLWRLKEIGVKQTKWIKPVSQSLMDPSGAGGLWCNTELIFRPPTTFGHILCHFCVRSDKGFPQLRNFMDRYCWCLYWRAFAMNEHLAPCVIFFAWKSLIVQSSWQMWSLAIYILAELPRSDNWRDCWPPISSHQVLHNVLHKQDMCSRPSLRGSWWEN